MKTPGQTANDLAERLQMMILGATGALVRVTVWDYIRIVATTEADCDAAVAFIGTRPGFGTPERSEVRGTWRALFRPSAAAA